MVTEVEVRRVLNKLLRQSLTDREWALLVELRDVSELLDDIGAAPEIAKRVKAMRKTYSVVARGSTDPDSSVPPTRSAGVGARSAAFARALSENIAAEADLDPQTTAFRVRHLPDGLIALDQVSSWITQNFQEQSCQIQQARVRIPGGWQRGEPLPSAHAEVFVEQLQYIVLGKAYVQQVVVAPGGVLASLRRLAAGLAAAHGWEPAQAATWVLTGVTPLVGLIRVTERRENIRGGSWMAWSERINLDVHAAATPEEVTEAYRAARLRHDRSRTSGHHRVRSQSIPHLILAGFVARRQGTWEQKRTAWNTWIGQQTMYEGLKRYDFISTFRRDAALACKRVLYRGYYAGRGAATQAAADTSTDIADQRDS